MQSLLTLWVAGRVLQPLPCALGFSQCCLVPAELFLGRIEVENDLCCYVGDITPEIWIFGSKIKCLEVWAPDVTTHSSFSLEE